MVLCLLKENQMHLTQLKTQFVAEHYRGVAENTSAFLDACVGSYRTFLGRAPETSDLNRASLNSYVDWMFRNRAYDTMRTQRSGLLMLWRYAADVELADPPPRVRLPKKVPVTVQAWSVEEVSQLRDYCLTLGGEFPTGVTKANFWSSLVACAYETGFRLSDQLSLEYSWISSGKITLVESKTGKTQRRQLSSQTIELVGRCFADQPRRRLVWPLWARREAFFENFRRIVADSGVRPGTFKYLRRAAATAAEQLQAGGGTLFLQHSSPKVTRDSYLDESLLTPIIPQIQNLLPLPGDNSTSPR